ncbi:hypothetical protein ANRL1_02574 [Anaerolineae bacterium]|nr:hypothetical protein ANRL1_02574 [Anaerolineae bacterium]
MLTVSDLWQTTWPGAKQGVLIMRDVANPTQHPELDQRKSELEQELRARFANHSKAALNALPSIKPYADYYNRFKKTYHVALQLESVALKGKSLPRVAALVEAMFMAELKNQLLTAGHDFDSLRAPLTLDIARGDEQYVLLNGKEETIKAGDICMSDSAGVVGCIIYGPDQRTRITPATRNVLFTVYAPPGIENQAIRQHLEDIAANVRLIAPSASTQELAVYEANPA